MVYRFSWLAGLAGLVFAFLGISSLLQPTTVGPPWQFVVVSGVALGIVITWTGITYRLNTWIVSGLNLVAMIIAVARISAPETTWFVLPTVETWDVLSVEFEEAFGIIRDGIEPVLPVGGIVIIVMVLFWLAGALLAWGLLNGHAYIALIPPLVLALQFATMDRAPTGWTRVTLFVVLVGGTILAVTTDERDQTAGRMARRGEWPSSRNRLAPAATGLLAMTLISSVGIVVTFDERLPLDGVLDWRTSTGLVGDFTGSVSYNPYVGIQQRLVNNSSQEVFYARVTGDVPADQVYFRLVTMETYNGNQFFANKPEMFRTDDLPWEANGHRFGGDAATIETDIQIDARRMDWLPAAYTPTSVRSTDSVERALRVRREDGSLRLNGGLSFRGMEYSVRSEIPAPDVQVLATTPTGELSPAFVQAQTIEDDELLPTPLTADEIAALTRDEPPNVEIYLEVPDEPEARIDDIADLAALRTKNLETDFEKALALEAWFHSPMRNDGEPLDGFDYSTDIEPGHGATDLAEWLLDPDSPNYHIGYCENFATAMAIMARTLDIPSRVVLGFTPGEPTIAEDVVVVRNRNAHAWVELWMPTQGWVRFDPTPRVQRDTPQTFEQVNDALEFSITGYLDVPDPVVPNVPSGPLPDPFLVTDDTIPTFLGSGDFGDTDTGGFTLPGWVQTLLPLVAFALVLMGTVPGAKWWRRRRRMKRLRDGDISAAWEEITSRLSDLGEPPAPALTPDEYAADVDDAMAPLATVYGRSLYGPGGAVQPHHVETATESLTATTERLTTRYSRTQRTVAMYRPGTLLPQRLRRRRNGKNGRNGS